MGYFEKCELEIGSMEIGFIQKKFRWGSLSDIHNKIQSS